MSNQSTDQMVLVTSPVFLTRVQYLLAQQARVVLSETGIGATHAARAAYAARVLPSVAAFAAPVAVVLSGGPNLIGTVVPGLTPAVTADSNASDAAILSQIATFWNALAGIDTGN